VGPAAGRTCFKILVPPLVVHYAVLTWVDWTSGGCRVLVCWWRHSPSWDDSNDDLITDPSRPVPSGPVRPDRPIVALLRVITASWCQHNHS